MKFTYLDEENVTGICMRVHVKVLILVLLQFLRQDLTHVKSLHCSKPIEYNNCHLL